MKRKSKTLDWPTFDSPLLQEIASAFLRRRKAIAYHKGLTCGREFSDSETGPVERLNLDSRPIRLSVWADGDLWLGVNVRAFGRNAGLAFQDAFHGDVQNVNSEMLVEMFEATRAFRFRLDPENAKHQLRELWKSVRPYAG